MADIAHMEAIAEQSEAAGAVADAIAAWRKAAGAEPERRQAHRALARLLRQEGRWNELLAALRKELEHACRIPEEKYAVLMEMVDIYIHHLERGFLAVNTAKRALEVCPQGIDALDVLISIYEEKRNWRDLAQVLERRLEQTSDAEARLELLERLAQAALSGTQNSRQAAQAYERMLEEVPGHAVALERLNELYTRLNAWEKLVRLKRDHELPFCDEAEKLPAVLELARLAQQRVRSTEMLRELWQRVRALDASEPEALHALEQVYRRTQEWEALAEVLASRAQASIAWHERIDVLRKLAALYEDKLNDASDAEQRLLEVWREVLALNPSDKPARKALRELFLRRGDLSALDELYADHDAKTYSLVLEQVVRRRDAPMRVSLLRRLGGLYRDDLGWSQKAVTTFEALAEAAPNDPEVFQTLAELYEEAGDYPKLAKTLARLLRFTKDAEGKAALLPQLAALHEEHLDAPVEALGFWLESVALRPGDSFSLHEAERLAEAHAAWQRLVDVYVPTAAVSSHGTRVALLETVARAQELHLQRLDAAGCTYEEILALDPAHREAHEGLARVLLVQERYDDLFEHYARRLGGEGNTGADPVADRLSVYHEVADLLEERIQRPAQALEMLGRALREVPGDTQVLDHLESLSERHAMWDALLALYRQVTSGPLPPAAQVAMRSRIGRLYEERLCDTPRALASYKRVLDLDPRNRYASQALERLEAS